MLRPVLTLSILFLSPSALACRMVRPVEPVQNIVLDDAMDAIDAVDEVVVAEVEAPEEIVPEAVEEAPAPTVEAKPPAEPTPRQPTT